MKSAAFFSFVFATLLPAVAYTQEYSYTHYDITEGLAGSTAYCITQDADGFIWVGTETGVSRFDGTHFKNFTTKDGLPDIEVLQIFGDSKGRVWMAPFKRSVCYYYRGKIYHPGNDSLLNRIPLKGNIEGFAEDAGGNVLIMERVGLHVVLANGGLRNIDSINGAPIRACTSICRSKEGHFLVQESNNIWNFSDSFSIYRHIPMEEYSPLNIAMNGKGAIWREGFSQVDFESFVTGKRVYLPVDTYHWTHISYSCLDDGYMYMNEATGTIQLDPETGKRRIFLPGMQVSKTFLDRDGSLWFTTMTAGAYRLNSDEFRTTKLHSLSQGTMSVSAILRWKNSVWVGTNHNQLFRLKLPELEIKDTTKFLPEGKETIYFIDTCRNGIIFCTGYGVITASANLTFTGADAIKSKWDRRLNSDEILVGNYDGVMIYNIKVGWITDTLWRGRTTTGFTDGKVIYFGSMNGLYRIDPDRKVVFLGRSIPFLKKRISSIAESEDGTLWVSSYDDAGIIGVRNDSVTATITTREGLTSNICRTLLIRGNVLWVGTDKGLNAIRLDRPGYPMTRYSSSDGLGSDLISALFADDSSIYAGTTAGISVFRVAKVQTGDPCRLRLLELINSGKSRIADTANLELSYKAKDIRFEYVGISYRSVGTVRYRYRMLGLDSNWRETQATFLDFPSLPSGGYRFELQATNKFGIRSELLTLPFRVQTPYWESIWFKALLLSILFGLAWLLVSWRIRYIRRRQNEREELIRQRAEMENKALAAQINPHFIFNCLNSIQQFMFDQDLMQTNEYVSGFARLIRATLNHSSKAFISVEEEVEYLTDYLALEKMRFKEKMDYCIEVDSAVDQFNTVLPPMLVQPYVENAMRHGLRNKQGGQGIIRITISKHGSDLVIEIEDNGIGRKKAMEYKTLEHIEYQSKGMSMTANRMKLIGAVFGAHIRVEMKDREANGKPDGTSVRIIVPKFTEEA